MIYILVVVHREVDDDGSGELEFEEFVQLAARFMVEEDAEAMQQELKEAFRLYDKEGNFDKSIKIHLIFSERIKYFHYKLQTILLQLFICGGILLCFIFHM